MRRTSGGSLDGGIALARLFVGKGTLAVRETKGLDRESIEARAGDGAITTPAILLVDVGTSSGAELFASALAGNSRADLIGQHTIGRAAQQRLVKLPDGSGLWLTVTRYLTPSGNPLHERGLEPTIAVDEPDVTFGQMPPATAIPFSKGDSSASRRRKPRRSAGAEHGVSSCYSGGSSNARIFKM